MENVKKFTTIGLFCLIAILIVLVVRGIYTHKYTSLVNMSVSIAYDYLGILKGNIKDFSYTNNDNVTSNLSNDFEEFISKLEDLDNSYISMDDNLKNLDNDMINEFRNNELADDDRIQYIDGEAVFYSKDKPKDVTEFQVVYKGVPFVLSTEDFDKTWEDIKSNPIYTYKFIQHKLSDDRSFVDLKFKSVYEDKNSIIVRVGFDKFKIDSITIKN